jgi:hypothetical protein
MSFHVIHANLCNSCKFMTIQFIHVHVIHVNSNYSCYVSFDFSGNSVNWVKGGCREGGGQICLPRPSVTASLSGQRQKRYKALLSFESLLIAGFFRTEQTSIGQWKYQTPSSYYSMPKRSRSHLYQTPCWSVA